MRFLPLFAAAAGLVLAVPAVAHDHNKSGGAGRTIVELAASNGDFSTLVAAVRAAGLADTLGGKGAFTVFAPTDAAFGKLPAGAVDTLLQPANREKLTDVLTYHVVPGRYPASRIVQLIRQGNGSASLTTVEGSALTARLDGSTVVLTDAKGGTSRVTATGLKGSNGLVHVIDTVVMP